MELNEKERFEQLVTNDEFEQEKIALWTLGVIPNRVYVINNKINNYKHFVVYPLKSLLMYHSLEMIYLYDCKCISEEVATLKLDPKNQPLNLEIYNTYRYELIGNQVMSVTRLDTIKKYYVKNFGGLLTNEELISLFKQPEDKLALAIRGVFESIEEDLSLEKESYVRNILLSLEKQQKLIKEHQATTLEDQNY